MRQKLFRTGLCVLCLTAFIAAAPGAENLELTTGRGTPVDGQLAARDPDGEEIHFVITTEPRKGLLTLYEDGSFTYTPAEGKRGRDYFGYRAVDAAGDRSEEATVIIRITRRPPAGG